MLQNAEIIVVEPGEASKSLEIAQHIFLQLLDSKIDKNAILLNLGGGVVTDLGGWIGANYKRGITTVHIPTSLLAMVDAALGGKTGLDLGEFKNMIGVIRFAKHTLICPEFLLTCPDHETKNGKAEMIKHALLTSEESYRSMLNNIIGNDEVSLDAIIASAQTKLTIVSSDPEEKNIRKSLNLGHTIGHAFESHFLKKGEPLAHGTAVAAGLAVELLICQALQLSDTLPCHTMAHELIQAFDLNSHEWPSYDLLEDFLTQDKKNTNGQVQMALLTDFGKCNPQVAVSKELTQVALDAFLKLLRPH